MIDFASDPNFNKGSEEIFESEPQILSKNQSQVSIDKNNAISNNPSIESSPINPADAFEVFQGKLFLPKDNVKYYTLPDSVEKKIESPLQKFSRLRGEILELERDLEEALKLDKLNENSLWSVLHTETNKLSNKLTVLEDNKFLKFDIESNQLLNTTEKLDSVLLNIENSNSNNTSSMITSSKSSSLTWNEELVLNNMAILERRITNLENIIGSSSNVIDQEFMANYPQLFPLSTALSDLEKRITYFDQDYLEKLKKSTESFYRDLEVLSKDKNKYSDFIKAAENIQDLSSKIDNISKFSDCLPDIVLRLKSLEKVHQVSANNAIRMQKSHDNIAFIKSQFISNKELLSHLKEELKSNIATMKENITTIDVKFSQVAKI